MYQTHVDESALCANDNLKPVVDLEKLTDLLPHGSGIDGNWYIQVNKAGNIRVDGSYHRMNEVGFYDGWFDFHFSIRRAMKARPLVNKGCVYTTPVVGTGDSELNEYLDETISDCICPLLAEVNRALGW
jgi:hypothetical protein